MAKRAYLGSNGTARRVKKGYLGIGGTARRIRRAYIGIGGVARPCWSGGEVTRYGKAGDLATAPIAFAGAENGACALFAGGVVFSATVYNTVNAYDASLARTLPDPLPRNTRFLAGTRAGREGKYALFGGGGININSSTNNDADATNVVTAYDTDLSRSYPTALGTARSAPCGVRNGQYGLFCGGIDSNWGTCYRTVEAYDGALTKVSANGLTNGVRHAAGTPLGPYALVGGGSYADWTLSSAMNAYSDTLTKTAPAALTGVSEKMGAAQTGSHAVFAGSSGCTAYDETLTRVSVAPLSVPRSIFVGAVSFQDHAVFAGGENLGTYYATVDVFDTDLTRTTADPLSGARYWGAGALVGDFALFAGGADGQYQYVTVDAYTID